MPGTKRDGKMAVKGVRVYMSHPAAKRLAEVLGGRYWRRGMRRTQKYEDKVLQPSGNSNLNGDKEEEMKVQESAAKRLFGDCEVLEVP